MNLTLQDLGITDYGMDNYSLGRDGDGSGDELSTVLGLGLGDEMGTNMSSDNSIPIFEMPNPEEMLHPATINPFFFHIIITYFITFVVGLLGNVFVVTVMVGDRKSRNATNLFLVR